MHDVPKVSICFSIMLIAAIKLIIRNLILSRKRAACKNIFGNMCLLSTLCNLKRFNLLDFQFDLKLEGEKRREMPATILLCFLVQSVYCFKMLEDHRFCFPCSLSNCKKGGNIKIALYSETSGTVDYHLALMLLGG